MLDMYSDFTMIHGQTGAHVEVLEIDDLQTRVDQVTDAQIAVKEQEIRDTFEFAAQGRDKISQPVLPEALAWSARVACGLDALVRDFNLNGLTYYYRGLNGNDAERLGASLIVGNSLLTAEGKLRWLAAEGESIPGPTMQIGNTNSRLRFGLPPAEFMDVWCAEGPTHHVALGVGHQIGRLRKLARLMGVEMKVIG